MASGYEQFTNEGYDVEGVVNDVCHVPPSYDGMKQQPTITASMDESNIQHQPHNPPVYPMWQPAQYPQQAFQFPQQQPGSYNVGVQQQQGAPGAQLKAPVQMNVVRESTWSLPKDYLWLSLIVTFCFCLPIGICALIYSCEVRHRSEEGDLAGAREASQRAKNLSIAGIICGFVLSAIAVVMVFVLQGSNY